MSRSETRLRLDELLPRVYDQLRVYASRALDGERAGLTLQTTDLVHEVYLRLSQLRDVRWANDQEIMRTAVGVMRRVLVDHARARKAAKRQPDVRLEVRQRQAAGEGELSKGLDLLDLDQALERLWELDPRKAEVVELRYFGGFSVEQVASHLDISPATVKRDWALAKAWLYRELRDEPAPG